MMKKVNHKLSILEQIENFFKSPYKIHQEQMKKLGLGPSGLHPNIIYPEEKRTYPLTQEEYENWILSGTNNH